MAKGLLPGRPLLGRAEVIVNDNTKTMFINEQGNDQLEWLSLLPEDYDKLVAEITAKGVQHIKHTLKGDVLLNEATWDKFLNKGSFRPSKFRLNEKYLMKPKKAKK